MKESEFIELLNLYVDHEISAEDAARLESEVSVNAARRRVYSQYCRIHKACSLLGGQFKDNVAPVGWSEAQPERGWNWMTTGAAAGLMAAACVAVVLMVRSHSEGPTSVVPQLAVASPASEESRVSGSDLQPVLAMDSLRLKGVSPAVRGENDPFAWINAVQMQPVSRIPVDEFFRTTPAILQQDARPARSSSLQAPVEMAAFRFQR